MNVHAKNKAFIWVIALENWPRAYLGAELMERGYEVTGFPEVGSALHELKKESPRGPEAIVLELKDQKITRDALDSLASAGVPTIGIAGLVERNNPLIQQFNWTKLLHRPVSIGKIADAVEECIASVSPKRNNP